MPPPLQLGALSNDSRLFVCLSISLSHTSDLPVLLALGRAAVAWLAAPSALSAQVRVRWATDAALRRRGHTMGAPQQVPQLVQTVIPQNVSVHTNHDNKCTGTTQNSSVIQ